MTLSVHQCQKVTKPGLRPMDYTQNLKRSLFTVLSCIGNDIDASLFSAWLINFVLSSKKKGCIVYGSDVS